MRCVITNAGGTFDAFATCAYGPSRRSTCGTVSDEYSGVDRELTVFHHELVEVAEVLGDVVVGERRVGPQHVVRLDQPAERGDVVLDHERPDERLEQRDVVGRVALHEPEVEERHVPAGPEQVVAGMRIAVERVQPVDAAEHEAVDRLGREIALGLRPLLDLGEARAVARARS